MKSTIIRHILMAVGVAVLATACSESPTSPGGGGGGGGNVTVSSVAVAGDVTLTEGDTSQLTATATMSDGSTQVVTLLATWSSANTAVASVSATGLVTARASGTAQVSASYLGQTGSRSLQVSPPTYLITVRAEAVTAIGTCDDFTQGSGNGEFAIRVRALRATGTTLLVYETRDYPGDPNGPFVLSLARNASLTLSGSVAFTLSGVLGQSVGVEFNATEWDTQLVIIPPRIDDVRDPSMNNRSTFRTHAYLNGVFDGIGARSLTLGDADCGIRLNYLVTATRQ